ncbi:MAG: hypothetical protein K0U16_07215 [Gammaproteobacteria bacterium]|nr:hypothetical protein [Gammaproteobacteria bacterium]
MTRKRKWSASQAARERRFDAIQRRRENEARRNPPERVGTLCYDPTTGTLGGDPDSPYAGLEVEIAAIFEDTNTVLIRHESLPDNELILPICPSPQITTPPPQPPDEPPPRTPPPEPPLEILACCYDVAAGRLRCEPPGSAWDGMEVSLLSLQLQDDGSITAIVMSEGFAPENSTQVFPICDDVVTDCCYDPSTQTLKCPGNTLDGAAAGIVASWVSDDGQIWVWAAWEGGGARMPLCPGTAECPPVFCCINMQTFNFVCPGRPDLNGQAAPIADVITENGYSWGVLEDGSQVPMCGERCPPPQLCPDCPTCPPGQWMSPDGTCADPPRGDACPPGMWRDPNGNCVPPPQCPECPPGTLLNTATGECVTCPPGSQPHDFPRFRPKKPCCSSCAHGGPCDGKSKKKNPSHRRRRKHRILSGN